MTGENLKNENLFDSVADLLTPWGDCNLYDKSLEMIEACCENKTDLLKARADFEVTGLYKQNETSILVCDLWDKLIMIDPQNSRLIYMTYIDDGKVSYWRGSPWQHADPKGEHYVAKDRFYSGLVKSAMDLFEQPVP